MNPRNLTREAIEELNDVEPHCFETDREEQWFNVGLQYGLDVADSDPKSPWISTKDDLPCNHKELIRKNGLDTKRVIVVEDDGYFLDRMVFSNNEWDWAYATIPSHWFPIPKLP